MKNKNRRLQAKVNDQKTMFKLIQLKYKFIPIVKINLEII